MNALEQLKEWLEFEAQTRDITAFEMRLHSEEAGFLLSDHGPAIVELIEAAQDVRKFQGEAWMRDSGALVLHEQFVVEFDAAHSRLRAAIAKLTESK